ncbi:WD40 repeat domain-containing serine/threonine protein kinase [Nocardiopsis coralliicola]
MELEGLEPADPERIGGYRLTRRLGEGGMGRVYLGSTASGRQVAIKVIRPALAREEGFRARFSREVEAARRVGGFHTAPVVDADPDGEPAWVATAYIPGPTLDRAVRDEGPLPSAALRTLAAGLAEGLQAVHACGLVHRDLKPGNIILSADGPRIIDFGIARPMDSESLTTHEAVFGTLPYMSPEQTENSHVGPASDLFSLGTVLAFAATGTNPFNGDSMAATVRRLIGPPPDPGDMDPEIRALTAECWNHVPHRRPTAEAVLARFAAHIDRPADPPPGTPREPAGGIGPDAVTHAAGPPAPTFLEPTRRVAGAPTRTPADGAAAARSGGSRRRALWIAASAFVAVSTAAAVGAVALRAQGDNAAPAGDAGGPELAATFAEYEEWVVTVAFSPDGSTLVTAYEGGTVELWDTGSWERDRTLIEEDDLLTQGSPVAAFNGAGDLLATGGESLEVWDTGTWEKTQTLEDEDWITAVALTTGGDTVAASDPVGRVRLWDTATGAESAEFSGPGDYMTSVAYSPDASVIATSTAVDTSEVVEDSDGGAIRLWDAATLEEVDALVTEGPSYEAVVFSPDNSMLAAVSGGLDVWDTGTWEERTGLPDWRQEDGVLSAAFSPDSGTLATGHNSGTIRLWDTATWKRTAEIPPKEDDSVLSLAFNPDGDTLAAGHANGTVRVWDLP